MSQIIPVHYRQTQNFRTITADGAFGGAGMNGRIQFALWNERPSLPEKSEITLAANAAPIENMVDGGRGITREIEVNVTMDINAAEAFHAWLGARIAEARNNVIASATQGQSVTRQ